MYNTRFKAAIKLWSDIEIKRHMFLMQIKISITLISVYKLNIVSPGIQMHKHAAHQFQIITRSLDIPFDVLAHSISET